MDRGLTILAALSCVALAAPAPAQETAPATAPAETTPAADLPAAADLVKRAIEASGGQDAFESIKAMTFKVEMAGPMGPVTKMDINSMRPDKFALSTVTPQGPASMGMKGDIAWAHDPFQGYHLIPEEQRRDIHMLDPYGFFYELHEHKAEYTTIDRLEFNGADCFKVRLSAEGDPDHFAYFDSESGHLSGVDQMNETPMGAMMITMQFDAYEDVKPLRLFTKAALVLGGNVMGTMNFSDLTFNEVEAGAFELPDEVKALVKEQAAQATTRPAEEHEEGDGEDHDEDEE
jgi:hypothetical protein